MVGRHRQRTVTLRCPKEVPPATAAFVASGVESDPAVVAGRGAWPYAPLLQSAEFRRHRPKPVWRVLAVR